MSSATVHWTNSRRLTIVSGMRLLAIDALRLQHGRGLRSSDTRDHSFGRLLVGSRCAGCSGELDIGLEFTWQRTQNIDSLDWQDLAEERDHKSCLAICDALRGGTRARRENDLRFHFRSDSQALKHFLDVAAARAILRICNRLHFEQRFLQPNHCLDIRLGYARLNTDAELGAADRHLALSGKLSLL